MPRRLTKVVILVEDTAQRDLLHHFLRACGLSSRQTHFKVSPSSHGSAEQYVRDEFPREIRDLRRRQWIDSMLIVMTDTGTVAARRAELARALRPDPPVEPGEPIVLLIPKRNVETWIRYCMGRRVDETTDYSRRKPEPSAIRDAAQCLLAAARAQPHPAAPDSLAQALPALRRIAHA